MARRLRFAASASAAAGWAAHRSFLSVDKPISPEANKPISLEANKPISLEELASHCGRDSCWLSVNGTVYDVTPLLQSHPGGASVLLQHAGRDVSKAFNALHAPEVLRTLGPHVHSALQLPARRQLGLLPTQVTDLSSLRERAWIGLINSFGLGGTTSLLTCIGLGGFLRRLLFWMIFAD